MPSKNEIKTIRSLKLKKHRNTLGLFVAEGEKLVRHLLEQGLLPRFLYSSLKTDDVRFSQISEDEMKQISFLSSPATTFAVFEKPKNTLFNGEEEFVLVLDGIRDPGNMGTILRLCDWFGVQSVFCTVDCVDVFNEKVVQASMGAIASTHVFYREREIIATILQTHKYSVFGADMEAENVYEIQFPEKTALVLGNEGQGISAELNSIIDQKITIPAAKSAQAESLNVATAAAILLSEYSRKKVV